MNNKKGLTKFVADARRFYPLLVNLTTRDIKVKYRRSILGILWSVLNPLLMMLVLTTVFAQLLRTTVPNFATYYIVGWVIWNFFSEATSLSMGSVLGGAALIKKVYIPKYIFPLEKCLFALVNFAFSLVAVIAVMLIQGVYPTFTMLLAPLPILYCFVFSVGFGLILSALTVYLRDIQHLYSVLLTVWMYLTPIIYPVSLIENNAFMNTVVHLNPLFYYVEYFRNVMMYDTIPSLTDNLVCVGMAVVSLLLGSFVFSKAQKKFILHI